jgi:hypothetical protein
MRPNWSIATTRSASEPTNNLARRGNPPGSRAVHGYGNEINTRKINIFSHVALFHLEEGLNHQAVGSNTSEPWPS